MQRRQVLMLGLGGMLLRRIACAADQRVAHADVIDFIPADRRQRVLSGVEPSQQYVQAAVSSGAPVVVMPAGARLRVEPAGTKVLGKARIPYCVTLPSNLELDLRGATLSVSPEHRAAVFVNDRIGVGEDVDIGIANGYIDGGHPIEMPDVPRELEVGCLTFHGVRRARIRNLTVTGARQYAGRFLRCADCIFTDLVCLSSHGDGWSFGIDANDQCVVSSVIERITSSDCIGKYRGLMGNGVIFTVQNCRVGSVQTFNCAGGIKIQDSSRDSSFEELTFEGGSNGTANSGIKVQGNVAAKLSPTGIRLNRVTSKNCAGEGLAIRFAKTVRVESYLGRRNSQMLKNRDIDLRGYDVHIGEISSYESQGEGLTIAGTGRYSLHSVLIEGARSVGFHIATPCRCDIDTLTVNSSGAAGISVTDAGVHGQVLNATVHFLQGGAGSPQIKSIAPDFHICAPRAAGGQSADGAC